MPTLNDGPGEIIEQHKTVAVDSLATGDATDVYMTHLAEVEFADANIKGAADKDAIVKVTAIAGNKVTISAQVISTRALIANMKTGLALPVQLIARGY